jgi:hypothetical protein
MLGYCMRDENVDNFSALALGSLYICMVPLTAKPAMMSFSGRIPSAKLTRASVQIFSSHQSNVSVQF